jgi:hypothetical protein
MDAGQWDLKQNNCQVQLYFNLQANLVGCLKKRQLKNLTPLKCPALNYSNFCLY